MCVPRRVGEVRGFDVALAGCRFLNMGIVATPVISDHKTTRCCGRPGTCVWYFNDDKLAIVVIHEVFRERALTVGWWLVMMVKI